MVRRRVWGPAQCVLEMKNGRPCLCLYVLNRQDLSRVEFKSVKRVREVGVKMQWCCERVDEPVPAASTVFAVLWVCVETGFTCRITQVHSRVSRDKKMCMDAHLRLWLSSPKCKTEAMPSFAQTFKSVQFIWHLNQTPREYLVQ